MYQTKRHLAFTLLVIFAPFLFFLVFSRAFHIPAGRLLFEIFVSFMRLIVAYCVAAVLAWIFAVLFYRGRRALVALPLFDVLQSFPTFAVLPLAVFVWGAGDFTIIFFLVLTILWPIFFSILSSLKSVKREWEEAAEILGLKGARRLTRFLFPISVPGLITGSIIGLGEGWEALVATEIIVGAETGLGNFFQSFSRNIPITSFGVLGFLILIFVINKAVWIPLLERSHERMEE